jgi:hypothetical protein
MILTIMNCNLILIELGKDMHMIPATCFAGALVLVQEKHLHQ